MKPQSNEATKELVKAIFDDSSIGVLQDKHTPGEWIVADFGEEIAIKEKSLLSKNGEWMFADRICTMGNYTTQNKANAELIVKAVNNYQSLVDEIESWKKEHFETVEMASETIKGLQEENKRLADNNRELLGILEDIKQWGSTKDGRFRYVHSHPAVFVDRLETAISNAKEINK